MAYLTVETYSASTVVSTDVQAAMPLSHFVVVQAVKRVAVTVACWEN